MIESVDIPAVVALFIVAVFAGVHLVHYYGKKK